MFNTGCNLQPDFKLSASPDRSDGGSGYTDSKLYMNFLTMEINRLYNNSSVNDESRPVIAISVNPGAVRSDIWRYVPFQTVFNTLMKCYFLEVTEGSATSIYASIVNREVIDDLKNEIINKNESLLSNCKGGEFIKHPDLPYLVPYHIPFPLLAFEMAGRFAGPRFADVSLPIVDNLSPSELATNLWSFSAELCKKVLLKANISLESKLKFLD